MYGSRSCTRFLRNNAAVRQQHSGIIHARDDTDIHEDSEEGNVVPEVEGDETGANITQAMDTLRSE